MCLCYKWVPYLVQSVKAVQKTHKKWRNALLLTLSNQHKSLGESILAFTFSTQKLRVDLRKWTCLCLWINQAIQLPALQSKNHYLGWVGRTLHIRPAIKQMVPKSFMLEYTFIVYVIFLHVGEKNLFIDINLSPVMYWILYSSITMFVFDEEMKFNEILNSQFYSFMFLSCKCPICIRYSQIPNGIYTYWNWKSNFFWLHKLCILIH